MFQLLQDGGCCMIIFYLSTMQRRTLPHQSILKCMRSRQSFSPLLLFGKSSPPYWPWTCFRASPPFRSAVMTSGGVYTTSNEGGVASGISNVQRASACP